MNGSKFMSIEVPHLKMKFIDSINYIPVALSKISKAFQVELANGYFPHLFNKSENQNSILNRPPNKKYYNPNGMMPEDCHKFMAWYDEHKNDRFLFEEIIKYCRSGVDILRRGSLKCSCR